MDDSTAGKNQPAGAQDDDVQLADIAARAAYLYEWVRPETLKSALLPGQLDELLQAIGDPPDPKDLDKYLSWLETSATGERARAIPQDGAAQPPAGAWLEVLQKALALANFIWPFSDETTGLDPAEPLPFQELLLPFVGVYHDRLAGSAGWHRLGEKARAQLCFNLLRELVQTSRECLFLEFQAFRSSQPFSELNILLARSGGIGATKLYDEFVRQTRANPLLLFRRYPVLARLLSELTEISARVDTELLARLESDYDSLQAWCAQIYPSSTGSQFGRVLELQGNLSDRHHGGRSVAILKFENEARVVYKPRSLGLELAFNNLLHWLNTHGAPLDQKVLGVLDRTDYGWMEFAPYQTCQEAAALPRFYQRLGMLLALYFVLEGTDCHLENLIACGEYPLLVDNESLLRPNVAVHVAGRSKLKPNAYQKGNEILQHSVMTVGLLPAWQLSKDRRGLYDVSGVGANGPQAAPFRKLHFSYINTDAMQLKLEKGLQKASDNVPGLNGETARLDEFVGDLQSGFGTMYRFLMAERDALLAEDGPFCQFRWSDAGGQGKSARFIFRNTQVYAGLLQEAAQPKRLRDGFQYSLVLERLLRVFLKFDRPLPAFNLLASERSDLYRQDIPYFATLVDDTALYLPDGSRLEGFLTNSSYQHARQKLLGLNQPDLEFQSYLIEMSMRTRLATDVHSTQEMAVSVPGGTGEKTAVAQGLPDQNLLSRAFQLADELQSRAIWGEDGSAAWIGMSYLAESEKLVLALSTLNLYDGQAGIALFFAACYHVRRDANYQRMALAALQPVREALLEQNFSDTLLSIGLGGGTGLGGLVYSLVHCAYWLDEPALLEDAFAAVLRLQPGQVLADTQQDVITGSAGCILGLLALQAVRPDAQILERAMWCGRHLLSKQVAAGAGKSWPDWDGHFLTGFSHGAAGYVVALLRLWRASGQDEFLQAARSALAYESGMFIPEQQNWPDLRQGVAADPSQPVCGSVWCHGSGGIGLARLDALSDLGSPEISQELEVAIATTASHLENMDTRADHLCCGNLGRIELLHEAGLRLDRPELLQFARQRVDVLVQNADALGGFRYTNQLARGQFNPGMFNGAAGVGYQLLRIAGQHQLPSVLLWE